MNQKQWFQLVVRSVGLIVFLYGVEAVYEAVFYAAGPSEVSDPRVSKLYALRGALEIALGVFFMRGAPAVVEFAFPPEAPPPGTDPDRPDSGS